MSAPDPTLAWFCREVDRFVGGTVAGLDVADLCGIVRHPVLGSGMLGELAQRTLATRQVSDLKLHAEVQPYRPRAALRAAKVAPRPDAEAPTVNPRRRPRARSIAP